MDLTMFLNLQRVTFSATTPIRPCVANIRIFNRLEQMIFNTGKPAQGWDGTFINNQCPASLYIHEVKAIGYDGIPHQKRGTVYLIR